MELEYKFYLPENSEVREIAESSYWSAWPHEPFKLYEHHAVYYSDRENKLISSQTALRLRRENERRILTIKQPRLSRGSLTMRREWNFPWTDKTPEPEELAALFDAEKTADGRKMAAFFRTFPPAAFYSEMSTNIKRLESVFKFPGCKAAVSIDEGILKGGSKTEKCRELEVEFISGDEGAFCAAAVNIKKHFSLLKGTKDKYSRLLALLEASRREEKAAAEKNRRTDGQS